MTGIGFDPLTQPQRFAKLCAVIGYEDQNVIDTLIEKGVDRETAEDAVEEAYSRLASEEANVAAERHLKADYGHKAAEE